MHFSNKAKTFVIYQIEKASFGILFGSLSPTTTSESSKDGKFGLLLNFTPEKRPIDWPIIERDLFRGR